MDPITRLNAALEGRYRIESELGEGGMATVYLADDLKHERKVALKVLKPELAAVVGAERFLAEIKTTANLQHPHILPLFDSGEADSFLFYVMPYVEGETLRDKLDRDHQLAVDDAVRIATAVGNALDYAHRQGVIHRDIKPSNILIHDGQPVISDFGIALAVGTAGQGRLTETGLSMGTPHYMSPEQATGDLGVGAATDVYALGCVLYEMLVGEPPYTGSTAQAILGKIISGKLTSATEVRTSVPAHVDASIRKSLEKVPADRFVSAQDFAKALDDPGFRYGVQDAPGVVGSREQWTPVAMGLGALASVFAAAFGWAVLRSEPPALGTRVSMSMQGAQAWTPGGQIDISADGSFLVYEGVAEGRENTQLWVRRLNALDAVPVPGTERRSRIGPDQAIAPDGAEVVVRHDVSIRVYPLDGGVPRTLVDDPGASRPQWSPDGQWVYYSDSDGGISRVSSGGGQPEAITERTTGPHHFVQVLPNGRAAVFEVRPGQIAAVDIESGQIRLVGPGEFPRYAAGYLFFLTGDEQTTTLLAAPFDPDELELTGPSVPIAEGLPATSAGNQRFAVSPTGTLVYQLVGEDSGLDSLVLVGRDGATNTIAPGWTGRFGAPALSPDATHIVVRADGGITVLDLRSGVRTRTSSSGGPDATPTWSPDGRSIVFSSEGDIFTQRADGSASPELLLDEDRGFFEPQWLPEGERMLLSSGGNILTLSTTDTILAPTVVAQGRQGFPTLSPDGSWLAYTSNQSGQYEVYVRPFPDTNERRYQISIDGGRHPVWANSGRELFYLSSNLEMVEVQIRVQPDLQVSEHRVLFDASHYQRILSIMPDDQYFVASLTSGGESEELILVQNLFEELRQRVPN